MLDIKETASVRKLIYTNPLIIDTEFLDDGTTQRSRLVVSLEKAVAKVEKK